jgi:hypothetical protein
MRLRDMQNFYRIVMRINIASHERPGTILEAQAAATYLNAGYTVELQPENGLCDARINLKDKAEWLYIECKLENTIDSKRFQSRQKFINELAHLILQKTKPFLPQSHTIEIMLPSDFRQVRRDQGWVEEIVKNNKLEQWKEINGIKYCVHSKKKELQSPPRHMIGGATILPSTPISLNELDVNIIYHTSNMIKRLLHLTNDARKQLPDNARGIMIVKALGISAMNSKFPQIIRNPGFKRVAGIVGLGYTWLFNQK